MDHDTKITLTVIIALIVLLGGLTFILKGDSEGKQSEQASDQLTRTPINQSTNTATTTAMEPSTTMPEKITSATIITNMGVIEIAFGDTTPATVQNFAKLASSGFYNGVRFHRVIKDFMIQTGDPLSKDAANKAVWGTGGPGYKFNDELTGNEKYPLGTVAMANAGPNTNGSQFFIVTANPGVGLEPNYSVFGRVTKGIETALKIQDVKTDPNDRPLQDVIIEKVEVR